MDNGDDGDLSISLSEHNDTAIDDQNIKSKAAEAESVSPMDGEVDIGKGFKGEAEEKKVDVAETQDSNEGVEVEEGEETGEDTAEREALDSHIQIAISSEQPTLAVSPPIVVVSPSTSYVTDHDEETSRTVHPEAEVNTKWSRSPHEPTDSTPPKRYDIESEEVDLHIPSYSSELDGRFHSDIDQQGYSMDPPRRAPRFSETEDAGLDFVEVTLDREVAPSSPSPYGPGAFYASRSAVEIRGDSISSDSEAARRVAMDVEERERSRGEHYLPRRERTESDGASSSSSRSSRTTGRSVEGRYMGRRSRPTSRVGSPEPVIRHNYASESRPSSMSLTIPHPYGISGVEGGGEGGLTMAVAGDDGEINIVSVNDRAMSSTTDLEQDENGTDQAQEGSSESEAAGEEEEEDGDKKSPMAYTESARHDEDRMAPSADNAGDEAAAPAMPSATMPSADSSNSLSDAADKEEGKRRRRSSNKPSALEQHVSRTRMTNLPPKPKEEDVKHLHDFELMMKLSREVEVKKQQEAEEKKRLKDAEVQENMAIWEKEILPSWTRARREVRLRKLWWKGIPSSIRGRLWALACGNNQMLPRNLFSKASAMAKERKEEGTFPRGDLRALDADIAETLPTLKLFQKDTGPLYDDLYAVLCAFVVVLIDREESKGVQREDIEGDEEVRVYQEGTASLAAMLLTNLSPSETVIALLNLIAERPWLRALFATSSGSAASTSVATRPGQQDPAAGFERVFDTLLADQMPKAFANMQARGVRPSAYVTKWVKTLFVPYLPFDVVARLWDCM
jgi:hypothetical protein